MHSHPQDPNEKTSENPSFPVVGIGASAGGLEALQKLLSRLSGDPMAFVVVQHLAAGRESALSEVLARATKLPVNTIEDGEAIKPARVYVAPPETDVRIEGDHFRLEVAKVPEIPRRTIDTFLRSLARARGRCAIGLILSGTGSTSSRPRTKSCRAPTKSCRAPMKSCSPRTRSSRPPRRSCSPPTKSWPRSMTSCKRA